MNILVDGAGATGSLSAARLKGAGHGVSILARGRRVADIREHGIHWEETPAGCGVRAMRRWSCSAPFVRATGS